MSKNNQYDINIGFDKRTVKSIKDLFAYTNAGIKGIEKDFKRIAAANPFVQIGQDAHDAQRGIQGFTEEVSFLTEMLKEMDKFSSNTFAKISKYTNTARQDIQSLKEISVLSETMKVTQKQFSEPSSSFAPLFGTTMQDTTEIEQVLISILQREGEGTQDPLGDLSPLLNGLSAASDILSILQVARSGGTVGLIVTALAALGIGIYAYSEHLKQARKDVIQSGKALEESDEALEEQKQKEKTIAWLTEQYRKHENDGVENGNPDYLRFLEQSLSAMYGDVVTPFDIQGGNVADRVEIVFDLAVADTEADRLKKQQKEQEELKKLPKLVPYIKELETSVSQLAEKLPSDLERLDEEKLKLDKAKPFFQNLQNQLTVIYEMEDKQAMDLAESDVVFKAQQFIADSGLDLKIDVSSHIPLVREALERRTKQIHDLQVFKQGELDSKQKELSDAHASYLKFMQILEDMSLSGKTIPAELQQYIGGISSDGLLYLNAMEKEIEAEARTQPQEKMALGKRISKYIEDHALFKNFVEDAQRVESDFKNWWGGFKEFVNIDKITEFVGDARLRFYPQNEQDRTTPGELEGEAKSNYMTPYKEVDIVPLLKNYGVRELYRQPVVLREVRPWESLDETLDRLYSTMEQNIGPSINNTTFSPNITVHGGGPTLVDQVRNGLLSSYDEFRRMKSEYDKHEGRLNIG